MNRQLCGVTVVAGLVLSLLGPATAAGAAPEHPPTRGTIQVCSSHAFDVYADGPSSRADDLATFYQSGECTKWKPVLPGNYEVGFALKPPAHYKVLIHCLIRRNHRRVFYKKVNPVSRVNTVVAPGQLTRIDLFIARG